NDERKRRGILRRRALRFHRQHAAFARGARRLIRAGIVETPLRAELVALKVVGQRLSVRTAGSRERDRPRKIAAPRREPTVLGPFDGVEQRLPTERPEPVLDPVEWAEDGWFAAR